MNLHHEEESLCVKKIFALFSQHVVKELFHIFVAQNILPATPMLFDLIKKFVRALRSGTVIIHT